MSFKSVFEQIFGFALLEGVKLSSVFVHNPKSQQIVQILTPDAEALAQLLVSASQAPAIPAAPKP